MSSVINIKRSGALGDVILTTPIIRKLRELNPDSIINLFTDVPVVYKNNPRVNGVFTASSCPLENRIDLDLVYERNPQMHIIDAYSQYVFDSKLINKRTELFPNDDEKIKVLNIMNENRIIKHKAVLIHMAKSWENRTIALHRWAEFIDRLIDKGLQPVIVGSGDDYDYKHPQVINLKNKLSIHHIYMLCSTVYAFVGIDSGLLHVAGATEDNTCKIFGIFTCAEAQYRMPFRMNTSPIESVIDCYGCLHRKPAPVTFAGCDRGDNLCTELINWESLIIQI